MYGLHAAVSLVLFSLCFAEDPCQKLAACAVEKCLETKDYKPTNKSVLVEELLSRTNFGCIFGPSCYDLCEVCPACNYAQEQIKKILTGKETDHVCADLEKCARVCIDSDGADPFSCVFRKKCAHHCLNESGCTQCYSVVKRVFTGICHRQKWSELFSQKCRPMFDELALHYVLDKENKLRH